MNASSNHPIHRRLYAEELVRQRRASARHRQAASQRRGRIDPNPHQIDAVMFALARIPEGGCILADEVGLGKTIEAGLVIAQLLSEGAARILIVVPRPLLGQWQAELHALFDITAREAAESDVDVAADGVYLVGREYAGGVAGSERLLQAPPFDLCIIDEAHEVFAGIYRRFGADGHYDDDSEHARTAHRVRQVIGATPVLLLTATPIQNSLGELWGLVQYIDRTGTLLGSMPTFVDLFCARGDMRRVAGEQADELRRRLATVVKRTLRRQAQEFLERPFVSRRAQLFEYTMQPQERALYDDVTEYLLEPELCAFDGRSRQLQLLGFHRRMASSTAALTGSLERVALRLRRLLDPAAGTVDTVPSLVDDLDGEDAAELAAAVAELAAAMADGKPQSVPEPPPAAERIAAELARVESFIARARSLPDDSKAQSLISAVRLVTARPAGRQKVVIFTESLATQEYLRQLLLAQAGLEDADITLYRGNNDSPRAAAALVAWRQEVGHGLAAHQLPSPGIAMRMALVHEFRTRSRVLISTEAGAKGLNLQFCDTLINYDLPWNPQRIEQRIGRCHRYGQTRDVTVINFLATDNEAQRLTFEILSTKLDLFGAVLDMSDVVLQTPRSDRSGEFAAALGPDFETELRRIWDRARSVREVEAELRVLRDQLEARRRDLEQMRERTIGLIENRLDDSVKTVFRQIQHELPAALAAFDAELERVLVGYLGALGCAWAHRDAGSRRQLELRPSAALPAGFGDGAVVVIGAPGAADEGGESLHAAHPLIAAAVDEARRAGSGAFRVRFVLAPTAPVALVRRRGARGRLALTRVTHTGFEREDRLMVTAVFEDAEVLRPAEAALELLKQPCVDLDAFVKPLAVTAADLDEVVAEELFLDHAAVDAAEQTRFEQAIDQLDQYMEDRILVLRRSREDATVRLRTAEQRRDGALSADVRGQADAQARAITVEIETMDANVDRLTARDDAEYARFKTHAHARRYGPPRAERLLEAEFEIG